MTDNRVRVVSVSLGSSRRDERIECEVGGRDCLIERVGTDGSLRRAAELIRRYDCLCDAIGLGGIDLHLQAGRRRYAIRDAARLAAAARHVPVVDGGGLKNSLEIAVIRRLDDTGRLPLAGKRALLVSAVDRWGMAEALAERCAAVTFGDLVFALGVPIPLRGLGLLERLARLVLPAIVRLPFSILYPTGDRQHGHSAKHAQYFAAADVIAGDWHYIRRFLPPEGSPAPLAGKAIVTNTTTLDDVELLRRRGAAMLVTTTPRLHGRSFGTNVIEALLTALAGSRVPLPPERLLSMLDGIGWEPGIECLDTPAAKEDSIP